MQLKLPTTRTGWLVLIGSIIFVMAIVDAVVPQIDFYAYLEKYADKFFEKAGEWWVKFNS